MKMILIPEGKLDELVELALARISKNLNTQTEVEVKYQTVHFYIHKLKREIEDAA